MLKDAALKGIGDVRTDPRHLTVGLSINGHNQTSSSGAASAPLQRCMLRTFEMQAYATEQSILMSVAIAGLEHENKRPNLDVICDNPNVGIKACEWLQ